MKISSKSNPLIKEIVKLSSDRKYRENSGLYIVEGVKPVNECLSAKVKIRTIICTEEQFKNYPTATVAEKNVFSAISTEKTPQGVIAVVGLPENNLDAPKGNCLLLDRIQDPGNLGTIIRTANAAGYQDIYLLNCTDAYSPKCVRASMSGIFFVNIHSGDLEGIEKSLSGVPLICADMDGEDIFSFKAPEKFCLCIGNEGGGISKEIFGQAAYKVKIPMRESCESLNAAVSAGIAMYQLKNNKRG